jgi:uncharacterized repeat protein (TIGR01451 family)
MLLRLMFKVCMAMGGLVCAVLRTLAVVLACAAAAATTAHAATPAGADIVNTARFEVVVDGITLAVDGAKGVRTSSITPSRVTLSQILPASQTGAPAVVLLPTSCRNSAGVWGILPAPSQSGAVVPTNTNVRTAPSQALHGGDPLLITLTDHDQNRDLNLAETVLVTLRSQVTGDVENLRLTETGPSTGVFSGYIQTTRSASTPGDCVLGVAVNDNIAVKYQDAINGDSDTSNASVMVDPLGRVFDSRTGALINGATVSLVNVDTGAPAVVFSDDGVTRYPSTLTSGGSATDAAGNVLNFTQGVFRFPLVAPGNYRLVVKPPLGYSHPSVVLDPLLQALANAPWQLGTGSRGGSFVVPPGVITVVDIPLDPRLGQLELTKTSAQTDASAGDFVAYSLSLRNPDSAQVTALVLHDVLPEGFRLQAGSVRLKRGSVVTVVSAAIDKTGRHIALSLPDIAGGEVFVISYVVEVTAVSRVGNAVNSAQAAGNGSISNEAQATVRVKDELMSTTSILVGSVMDGCDRATAQGIAGVRVLMEDGRTNLSDATGRWHFEQVHPGNHVVQLDRISLPKGYLLRVCDYNSRSAKAGHAQMVDLKPGSLWQVDFVAVLDTGFGAPSSAVSQTATATATAIVSALPVPESQLAGTVAAGYDDAWLASAAVGNAIEFPASDFVPRTSAVGLAVRHLGSLRPVVFMNGQQVNAVASDGSSLRADKAVAVSLWRSLPLREGKNIVSVQLQDAQGKVVQVLEREVYYSSIPVAAKLVPAASRLLADGRTPIVLAVRLTDAFDRPLRAGMTGAYQLQSAYAINQPLEPSARDPLADTDGATESNYVVGEDGIARIELAPSSVPGPLEIKLALANGKREVLRAWVDVVQREWMVVGLADTTLYGKKLKEDMQPLAGAPGIESLDHAGRIALYAVGTVGKDSLLTLAYDTAKERGVAADQLAQAMRSDEQYLVYADASNAGNAALSSSKLYLRLDRAQFSALFGDFSTELGGGSLAQYNRSLTGLHVHYRGEPVQVIAFAARTGAGYARDEIALDATAGAYKLSRRDIVPGTDKLKVQVRSTGVAQEVLEERLLARFVNYRIDYSTGQVVLSSSMPSPPLGQRLVLVAEYETSTASQAETVAGARISAAIDGLAGATAKGEVGAKLIRDNTPGTQGTLVSTDIHVPIGSHTNVRAEIAASRRADLSPTAAANAAITGQAWQAEVTHQTADSSAKAYAKQTDGNFGLGTLSGTEVGLHTVGVQATHKLGDTLSVVVSAESSRRLSSANQPELDTRQLTAGLQGQINASDNLSGVWSLGLKQAWEDTSKHAELITAGIGLTPKQGKWSARLETEQALGHSALSSAPEKWLLSGAYKVDTTTDITVGQQWLRTDKGSASLAQAGLRYAPADFGVWSAGVGQGFGSQGDSVPMLMLGVEQRIKFGDGWSVGGNYMRQQWTGVDTLLSSGITSSTPTGLLDNYQSLALELNLQRADWTIASRAQWRHGDSLSRDTYGVTAYRKLGEGVAASAGALLKKEDGLDTQSRSVDLRLAWSRRAHESHWVYFHRLDWINSQRSDLASQTEGQKMLSNFHANRTWSDNSQISLHHGVKKVKQSIDDGQYAGVTHFVSIEGRYSLGANWDVGANAFGAYSVNSQVRSQGVGASLGVKLNDSAWVSLGYNRTGLRDGQFSEADHVAKGFYLRLRWRFDQDTLHLNPENSGY